MVEFALLAPLLVVLLIGLVELGRYSAFAIQIGNAARAGAAYGARQAYAADDAGMQTAAKNDALPTVISATSGHTCTCADGSADASCAPSACSTSHMNTYVYVTASGTFTSLFNYPGLPSSIPMSSTATLQVSE